VSLADKAGVLKNAFDKRDLKRRKERIKQIGAGNVTAAAAQEVIEAVQAAVLVAVIMPAVIGTATSS
jgi:hypothetical protein